MHDPYKMRAMALLIAAGFAGGLLLQWKAPGQFVPPARHKAAPKKRYVVQRSGGQDDEDDGEVENVPMGGGSGAPADESASGERQSKEEAQQEAEAKAAEEAAIAANKAAAEKTPPRLGKYAAILAILDNTIEATDQFGRTKSIYFATRGVTIETEGEEAVGRIWKREEDQICQPEGAAEKKCFNFTVRLESRLLDGPATQIQARIDTLPTGAQIGEIDGTGFARAILLRGNVKRVPDYLPLLDGKPNVPSLLSERPDAHAAPSFIGSLLLQSRRDLGRAATFFAPWGHLIEAQRDADARDTVHYWFGAWRRNEELICRDLKLADGRRADPAVPAQECSPVHATARTVEFPAAALARQHYFRQLWPGENADEIDEKAAASASPQSGASQPAEKPRSSSFTDLR